MFGPWWFVIAVIFAAWNIQRASIGGTRRQPSKLARETPRKTDADGAQLLAWMAAVNQRLGRNRLQKQSSS